MTGIAPQMLFQICIGIGARAREHFPPDHVAQGLLCVHAAAKPDSPHHRVEIGGIVKHIQQDPRCISRIGRTQLHPTAGFRLQVTGAHGQAIHGLFANAGKPQFGAVADRQRHHLDVGLLQPFQGAGEHIGGRSRIGERSALGQHPLCNGQRGPVEAQMTRQPRFSDQLVLVEDVRVVGEVAAYTGQIVQHFDAVRAQLIRRPNPGEHQQLG